MIENNPSVMMGRGLFWRMPQKGIMQGKGWDHDVYCEQCGHHHENDDEERRRDLMTSVIRPKDQYK